MKQKQRLLSEAASQLGKRSWAARKATQNSRYFSELGKKGIAVRWARKHAQSQQTPNAGQDDQGHC
jgi:hypothetical protein